MHSSKCRSNMRRSRNGSRDKGIGSSSSIRASAVAAWTVAGHQQGQHQQLQTATEPSYLKGCANKTVSDLKLVCIDSSVRSSRTFLSRPGDWLWPGPARRPGLLGSAQRSTTTRLAMNFYRDRMLIVQLVTWAPYFFVWPNDATDETMVTSFRLDLMLALYYLQIVKYIYNLVVGKEAFSAHSLFVHASRIHSIIYIQSIYPSINPSHQAGLINHAWMDLRRSGEPSQLQLQYIINI